MNVPNRSHIEIHEAINSEQLHGCIGMHMRALQALLLETEGNVKFRLIIVENP
jgi:copper(I)-binding protein